jgi:O-antigen ligase
VLAFTIYAVIRYLYSDIEYIARQELIHVILYALLFFAILNNLNGQEEVQIICVTLVILAMFISFYALYQFVTGSNKVWNVVNTAYPHRAMGTYFCPNHLGGFLEMILPLGLAYTLASRLNPVMRIILGYASLVIVAGIAVTISRGTWIATGVALLAFFTALATQRGHRLIALIALLLMVGGGVYFLGRSPIFQKRVQQIGIPKHSELDTRILIWNAAVGVWRENVWWGVGPGHFDYRFGQHRPDDVQLRPVHTHNDYLNTLTDWGVAGAALVAAALALVALGVMKTWRFVRGSASDLGPTKNRNKFAFVVGASAGLIAILVHSFVDFNMHIAANAILAVTLMALLSSYLRFATERYWVGVRVAPKMLITLALLAGAFYLGQQGTRQAREFAYLREASSAPPFSPAMIASLKKAFAIESTNPDVAATIGECYRVESSDGANNYRELGEQAIEWFGRSLKLNPWNSNTHLQYGRTLDWLDRSDEAEKYFNRALELDPNNFYTLDGVGMHYVKMENYAAARPWFERSLRLQWENNPIARNYGEIVERRLLQDAGNRFPPPPVDTPSSTP